MSSLKLLLQQAFDRRQSLRKITNALRLVNGQGDGLDGLLVDQYDKHFQIQILKDSWQKNIEDIKKSITSLMPVEYLIVKSRQGLEMKSQVLIEGNPQTIVEEHGIKFKVHLHDGLNCGLFLDMRHNRWMVAQASKDKKMLNCFAYTCSFGLYARLHGAEEIVNVDISRKVLKRAEENYQLNDQSWSSGEFVAADSVSYLTRAFKIGNTFDVIVLDPPSFARHENKNFQVKRDLPKLMALAAAVLNPQGRLFVSTNYSEITHHHLERALSLGLNGRKVDTVARVGQDEDFVGTNSFKESYLAGLWVKFL